VSRVWGIEVLRLGVAAPTLDRGDSALGARPASHYPPTASDRRPRAALIPGARPCLIICYSGLSAPVVSPRGPGRGWGVRPEVRGEAIQTAQRPRRVRLGREPGSGYRRPLEGECDRSDRDRGVFARACCEVEPRVGRRARAVASGPSSCPPPLWTAPNPRRFVLQHRATAGQGHDMAAQGVPGPTLWGRVDRGPSLRAELGSRTWSMRRLVRSPLPAPPRGVHPSGGA
jgi:hypothetical protein